MDKTYSNKEKRYNSQFCKQYVNHYLDNEPIPSLDMFYETMKQMVPMLPVEVINQLMKEMVSTND